MERQILVTVVGFLEAAYGVVEIAAKFAGIAVIAQRAAGFTQHAPEWVALEFSHDFAGVQVFDQVAGGVVFVVLGATIKTDFFDNKRVIFFDAIYFLKRNFSL